jgi:hypothetical protein
MSMCAVQIRVGLCHSSSTLTTKLLRLARASTAASEADAMLADNVADIVATTIPHMRCAIMHRSFSELAILLFTDCSLGLIIIIQSILSAAHLYTRERVEALHACCNLVCVSGKGHDKTAPRVVI